MSLARAIPLKDATQTAVSSGALGTAYDMRTEITAGYRIFSAIHVTTQSTDQLIAFVQSASSSGFTTPSTEFIYTAMTSRGAQWATSNGVTLGSTERGYWRMRWTLSTGSNNPSAKFMNWLSIQP